MKQASINRQVTGLTREYFMLIMPDILPRSPFLFKNVAMSEAPTSPVYQCPILLQSLNPGKWYLTPGENYVIYVD